MLSFLAAAQTTGTIQGTVSDQQGAVMPGVTLKLVNAGTNLRYSQTSGELGGYIFSYLPPGKYALQVSAPGFRAASISEILVEVSRNTVVDVRLEIGAVNEAVEVKMTAERIDTVAAQVATNVPAKYMQDLPSLSRNVLAYAEMAPGVEVDTSNTTGGSQVIGGNGTVARTNGNRENRNNYYLDGADNAGFWRNTALQMPNPDAVAEVQVSTSNTSAEHGRQSGGMFNVITKSGTNALHGTAFYFFRSKYLNANDWNRNLYGMPRVDDPLKTVGGVIGGPIRKDRLFYFLSFDRFSDEATGGFLKRYFAPSPKQLQGDFSESSLPIYDPNSTAAAPVPFAGNQIPASRIDKVGQNLANLLPTVPTRGERFSFQYTQPVVNRSLFGKADQRWNDKNFTSFSWLHTWGNMTNPGVNSANNLPNWGPQVNTNHQNTLSARHTWLVRSSVILESHFGWVRHIQDVNTLSGNNHQVDMTALGAQNVPITQEGARKYLPQIGVGGGMANNGLSGHTGYLAMIDQHEYKFGQVLSLVRSSHNLKFGADMARDTLRQIDDRSGGSLGFDGRYSSLMTVYNNFDYSMADLMMGRTTGFSQSGIKNYELYNWNAYFFAQDEWKVTRRLTLTPGLRYEFYLPSQEKRGRMSEFLLNNRSTALAGAPIHLAFPGDPGVPSGFFPTEWGLVAPRIGMAWDLTGDGRTALRAGFGKHYSYTSAQVKMLSTEMMPWLPSASCNDTIASNPWLACKSPTYAAPPTPFTDASYKGFKWPSRIDTVYGFDPNYKTAYSYQFNISFEREVRKGVVLQGGYVGNRGRNLTHIVPYNWSRWAPDASDLGANLDARRPLSGFKQAQVIGSSATSRYDSFQAVANLNLPQGLLARFTYVFAHGWGTGTEDPYNGNTQTSNPQDLQYDWGELQRRHAFKLFYSWNIPFLKDHNGLGGKLLGGWQLSGIGRFYSGAPSNVTIGRDWNFDSVTGDRPDLVGSIGYAKQWLGNGWMQYIDTNPVVMTTDNAYFERGPFKLPGNGVDHNTFGNLRRNAVFGPGYWGMDGSIMKNFHITEAKYFQIRLESYNVANHPMLNSPNLSFTSADFGKINGKNGYRRAQVGVKFYF